MNDKPGVLWVCDEIGWAFDKIIHEFIDLLPNYRHTVVFINRNSWISARWIKRLPYNINVFASIFDVVICMVPPQLKLLKRLDNVILRLDGFRSFERAKENAHDAQYREYQKVELGPSYAAVDKKVSTEI